MACRSSWIGVVVLGLSIGPALEAQPSHTVQPALVLHGPIEPGPGQTLTGEGAPDGPGIYVELWRVAPGARRADSVMSVAVGAGGFFAFEPVDVGAGELFHVTLSYSWQFETDDDLEGWDDDVSHDVLLGVSGGTLQATILDGDGDGFRDPYFRTNFEFDAEIYRVIEIRFRNPASVPDLAMTFLWGAPWGTTINGHGMRIPAAMGSFETFVAPMNVQEFRLQPGPAQSGLDGLWTDGPLSTALRVDPLDGIPRFEAGADGVVFEIDSIRIREDFRLDFETDGDLMGLRALADIEDLTVADGFLSYRTLAAPVLQFDVMPGRIESGYFTHFVIGMDNPSVAQDDNAVGLLFRDDDSGDAYVDDDGTEQFAEFPTPFTGRQDFSANVDRATIPAGEWTEDGRAPVQGLQLNIPQASAVGDEIRIDYLGFTPELPFGPSQPVLAVSPNNPPLAAIVTEPSPPVLLLREETVQVVLDARQSDDGDGGEQGLAFLWEKLAGPDGDTLSSAEDAVVAVEFTRAGEYVYRLTVDDGQSVDFSATAEVVITVREPLFVRGDVNANGTALEVVDAIELVIQLVRARTDDLVCSDAADVDDDGALTFADALSILFHHYGEGVPPAPFPDCGADGTDDALRGCDYPEDFCSSTASLATTSYEGNRRWKKIRKAMRKLGKTYRKEVKRERRRSRRCR